MLLKLELCLRGSKLYDMGTSKLFMVKVGIFVSQVCLTIHPCNVVLFMSLNTSRNDILGMVGLLVSQTHDSCVI